MRVDLCLNPRKFSAAEVREMIPALRDLLSRHDVQGAYLFGSTLKDSSTPLSDLDIGVLPPPDRDDWLGYYNDLYGELCQLFQADNIDLVLLNQAPLPLQANVVLNGLRIIDSEKAEDLEESVLARQTDLVGWRQENWTLTRELARRGATREVNMIDKARVERFVLLIRDAVRELRSLNLEEIGLERYHGNKHTRALSEHYLRLAIEATLDLGRHVIVKTGLGVPQEYREIGKILHEKGLVPTDLARQLEAMAGMRNVLVHLYWDLDYTLLYKSVVEGMDTFERLIECIFLYLDQLEAKEQ